MHEKLVRKKKILSTKMTTKLCKLAMI